MLAERGDFLSGRRLMTKVIRENEKILESKEVKK
jgi:hypothetical protein